MYKIETHLHTTYNSHCGWLGAKPIVRMYRAAGYNAILVTDHYNRQSLEYCDTDFKTDKSQVENFLTGYRRVKKEADKYGDLKVYAGAEVRFDGSENDYLVIGLKPHMLDHPEEVISGGLERFYKLCEKEGALLIQAHPFRHDCTPADPALLHGVEVYNCNARHENNNDLALKFAKENNLIMIGGSDFHEPVDVGLSGILTDTLPEDSFQLADIIRNNKFEIIK